MSRHSSRLFTASLWAAVFFVFAPSVFAQVQVVESPAIRGPGQQVQQTQAPTTNPDQLVEIFYQMQQLQQQVQVLTGMVEEANYELKRLKQQQLDDYVDLDRRVSELSQGGVAPSVAVQPAPNSTTRPPRPLPGMFTT